MPFAGVEALLAEIHGIASDRRTAFQARMKNLLRVGLVEDVKAGRGKAAKYEVRHILSLAVALEFAQLGVTPERVVSRFKDHPETFARGFRDALTDLPDGQDDAVYIFSESTLAVERPDRPAQTVDRNFSQMLKISDFEKLAKANGFLNHINRAGIINLSRLLRQIAEYLTRENLATIAQIKADVEEWAAPFKSDDAGMIAFMDRASHALNKKA